MASISEKDLQHGASNGCWEFFVTQLQSLYTLPSISQSTLNQQKAVASVTAGVYQIRTRFYRMHQCHVSAKQEGKSGDHVRASPGDSTAIPKLLDEKSCHVWHCVSVECFDSMNSTASKQPGWKNVDILLLKTVYFLLLFCLFFFWWHWLPTFWALLLSKNVPERMLIKGKMGIQGKRLYKFFS